jgi:CNT family concentrative nucleoside transporter
MTDIMLGTTPPAPEITPPADQGPAASADTPLAWRIALGAAVVLLGLAGFLLRDAIGGRGQAVVGFFCVLGFVAMCSADLRAVSVRTLLWGIALQWLLALFVINLRLSGLEWLGIPDGFRPGYALFSAVADAVRLFLDFSARGSKFVFGPLVDDPERAFGPGRGFIFAFAALPTIIFVSSFFTVLFYLGVLQWIVRVLARLMIYLMRTSGAESLSAVANVFMGQTEAPLIVKPYVARMTQSELLALMVGGMATISGGLMAVYIQMGADPVAILATSVMAAPCGLYLSKLLLPEREEPETRGVITSDVETPHRNVIDAAAGGASDGLFLALNVAAMLIAFLAFLALVDFCLGRLPTGQGLDDWLTAGSAWTSVGRGLLLVLGYVVLVLLLRPLAGRLAGPRTAGLPLQLGAHLVGFVVYLGLCHVAMLRLPDNLSLSLIFSRLFAPLAFLMGVEGDDIFRVADLLGTKLALNEFVAYVQLTTEFRGQISQRSYDLATYALTGFANFSSVGIQLGGIGAMAPARRGDLARLGSRALLVGFLATILNAAVAGILMGL